MTNSEEMKQLINSIAEQGRIAPLLNLLNEFKDLPELVEIVESKLEMAIEACERKGDYKSVSLVLKIIKNSTIIKKALDVLKVSSITQDKSLMRAVLELINRPDMQAEFTENRSLFIAAIDIFATPYGIPYMMTIMKKLEDPNVRKDLFAAFSATVSKIQNSKFVKLRKIASLLILPDVDDKAKIEIIRLLERNKRFKPIIKLLKKQISDVVLLEAIESLHRNGINEPIVNLIKQRKIKNPVFDRAISILKEINRFEEVALYFFDRLEAQGGLEKLIGLYNKTSDVEEKENTVSALLGSLNILERNGKFTRIASIFLKQNMPEEIITEAITILANNKKFKPIISLLKDPGFSIFVLNHAFDILEKNGEKKGIIKLLKNWELVKGVLDKAIDLLIADKRSYILIKIISKKNELSDKQLIKIVDALSKMDLKEPLSFRLKKLLLMGFGKNSYYDHVCNEIFLLTKKEHLSEELLLSIINFLYVRHKPLYFESIIDLPFITNKCLSRVLDCLDFFGYDKFIYYRVKILSKLDITAELREKTECSYVKCLKKSFELDPYPPSLTQYHLQEVFHIGSDKIKKEIKEILIESLNKACIKWGETNESSQLRSTKTTTSLTPDIIRHIRSIFFLDVGDEDLKIKTIEVLERYKDTNPELNQLLIELKNPKKDGRESRVLTLEGARVLIDSIDSADKIGLIVTHLKADGLSPRIRSMLETHLEELTKRFLESGSFYAIPEDLLLCPKDLQHLFRNAIDFYIENRSFDNIYKLISVGFWNPHFRPHLQKETIITGIKALGDYGLISRLHRINLQNSLSMDVTKEVEDSSFRAIELIERKGTATVLEEFLRLDGINPRIKLAAETALGRLRNPLQGDGLIAEVTPKIAPQPPKDGAPRQPLKR